MPEALPLAPAFADPVFDSQRVFRAVMAAFARPGTIEPVTVALSPPAPLSRAAAAIVLALVDQETPLWLDPALAAAPQVSQFIRFHTGASITSAPADAAFAVVATGAALPDFATFAQGTDAYPDRSTTLVAPIEAFDGDEIELAGPGIAGTQRFAARPLPADIAARWRDNHARFPRGVDLILCTADALAALPRSVRMLEEAC